MGRIRWQHCHELLHWTERGVQLERFRILLKSFNIAQIRGKWSVMERIIPLPTRAYRKVSDKIDDKNLTYAEQNKKYELTTLVIVFHDPA